MPSVPAVFEPVFALMFRKANKILSFDMICSYNLRPFVALFFFARKGHQICLAYCNILHAVKLYSPMDCFSFLAENPIILLDPVSFIKLICLQRIRLGTIPPRSLHVSLVLYPYFRKNEVISMFINLIDTIPIVVAFIVDVSYLQRSD
jgi:hypothetical protein